MKKTNIMIAVLLLLPLIVVGIASSPSSVIVFDGQTTTTISYLQTVPGSIHGWCAPVAALLNYLIFGLAVFYALLKKKWALKGIRVLSFVAACIAVMPVLAQTEIKIIPNAFVAIFLLIESLVAHVMAKSSDQSQLKKMPEGARLNRH